jgi:hypothetical protein
VIRPSDIEVEREERGNEIVLYGGVNYSRVVHVQPDSAAVEDAERELRRECWHAIYGDIEPAIDEQMRAAMSNLNVFTDRVAVAAAFEKVRQLFKNPF